MTVEELEKLASSLGLLIKIQVRETLGLCFFRIVVAEQKDVPLVVLKAQGDVAKLVNDESVLRSCVQTARKKGGISAYPSKSSKQNWHIDMICNAKKTTLNFSVRTNAPDTRHKLNQYVNLAVKFNGLVQ